MLPQAQSATLPPSRGCARGSACCQLAPQAALAQGLWRAALTGIGIAINCLAVALVFPVTSREMLRGQFAAALGQLAAVAEGTVAEISGAAGSEGGQPPLQPRRREPAWQKGQEVVDTTEGEEGEEGEDGRGAATRQLQQPGEEAHEPQQKRRPFSAVGGEGAREPSGSQRQLDPSAVLTSGAAQHAEMQADSSQPQQQGEEHSSSGRARDSNAASHARGLEPESTDESTQHPRLVDVQAQPRRGGDELSSLPPLPPPLQQPEVARWDTMPQLADHAQQLDGQKARNSAALPAGPGTHEGGQGSKESSIYWLWRRQACPTLACSCSALAMLINSCHFSSKIASRQRGRSAWSRKGWHAPPAMPPRMPALALATAACRSPCIPRSSWSSQTRQCCGAAPAGRCCARCASCAHRLGPSCWRGRSTCWALCTPASSSTASRQALRSCMRGTWCPECASGGPFL